MMRHFISLRWRRDVDATLKRYLLGQLDPGDDAWLEQRYFQDDGLFERVLLAEEELMDAYLRDELSGPQRARFESRFLTTAHGREKIEATRALIQCLAEHPEPVPPRPGKAAVGLRRLFPPFHPTWSLGRLSAVATAVAVLAAAGWLVSVNRRLTGQLDAIRRERAEVARQAQQLRNEAAGERARALEEGRRERAARDRLERTLAALQQSGSVVTTVLTPGLLRDFERPPQLVVPPGAGLILLQLEIGDHAYDGYRVVVRTVAGDEVWRQEVSKPQPSDAMDRVTVGLPARRAPWGDYMVTVQGRTRHRALEDVASYYFQVVRE
jgi:anti-sigma factor RsiW